MGHPRSRITICYLQIARVGKSTLSDNLTLITWQDRTYLEYYQHINSSGFEKSASGKIKACHGDGAEKET